MLTLSDLSRSGIAKMSAIVESAIGEYKRQIVAEGETAIPKLPELNTLIAEDFFQKYNGCKLHCPKSGQVTGQISLTEIISLVNIHGEEKAESILRAVIRTGKVAIHWLHTDSESLSKLIEVDKIGSLVYFSMLWFRGQDQLTDNERLPHFKQADRYWRASAPLMREQVEAWEPKQVAEILRRLEILLTLCNSRNHGTRQELKRYSQSVIANWQIALTDPRRFAFAIDAFIGNAIRRFVKDRRSGPKFSWADLIEIQEYFGVARQVAQMKRKPFQTDTEALNSAIENIFSDLFDGITPSVRMDVTKRLGTFNNAEKQGRSIPKVKIKLPSAPSKVEAAKLPDWMKPVAETAKPFKLTLKLKKD